MREKDGWRDKREKDKKLQAGETKTGVRSEMSDESEAFWEDAPV